MSTGLMAILRAIALWLGFIYLFGWAWFTQLQFNVFENMALLAALSFLGVATIPDAYMHLRRINALYTLFVVSGILASAVLMIIDYRRGDDALFLRAFGVVILVILMGRVLPKNDQGD